MAVSVKMILDLQMCMRGEAPSCVQADTEDKTYHVGALWYGDWRDNAEGGARFGSDKKSKHFAAITKRWKESSFYRLAPITSQKRGKDAVVLPSGTIYGGKLTESYLLYQIKLRASRKRLGSSFEYKAQLPARYVQEMKTRMHNDNKR